MGKIIGFDEILTGSWPDQVRYRRFWLFFCVFCQVSASPEIDATRRKTDLRNPTLLTGRLRVENLLPDLLRVGLRVGHKPDPPNPWTPLRNITTTENQIFLLLGRYRDVTCKLKFDCIITPLKKELF